jgi:hypothetical protein
MPAIAEAARSPARRLKIVAGLTAVLTSHPTQLIAAVVDFGAEEMNLTALQETVNVENQIPVSTGKTVVLGIARTCSPIRVIVALAGPSA